MHQNKEGRKKTRETQTVKRDTRGTLRVMFLGAINNLIPLAEIESEIRQIKQSEHDLSTTRIMGLSSPS